MTNRGRSRGMATVEFESKDDVKKAIERYDHFDYNGRQIFVRQDYPPPEDKRVEKPERKSTHSDRFQKSNDRYSGSSERFKTTQEAPAPGTEVFIGNIPFSMNWQSLKDLMRQVGEVDRADIRLDSRGRSMGYGTVVFKTAEEANIAIEKFQGYEVEGRKLDTRPGKTYEERKPPRSSRPVVDKNSEFTRDVVGGGSKSDTIFVDNLPFVTSQEDLFELFETIGKVLQAELQYDAQGRTSGRAVVKFESEDLAVLAIENLDNYNYGGRDLSITYALYPNTAATMQESKPIEESDAMEDAEIEKEATEEPMEETEATEEAEQEAEAIEAEAEAVAIEADAIEAESEAVEATEAEGQQ